MGQIINVTGTVSGDSAVFEADRSLSGQDGGSYESIEETADDPTFPARLAARRVRIGRCRQPSICGLERRRDPPHRWLDRLRRHAGRRGHRGVLRLLSGLDRAGSRCPRRCRCPQEQVGSGHRGGRCRPKRRCRCRVVVVEVVVVEVVVVAGGNVVVVGQVTPAPGTSQGWTRTRRGWGR